MKNNFNKNNNKQSGFILILAVLVIGAIVGIVSIFSNLIIRGIVQSRVINNSVQAYYLAESASEKALHQVRRRQAIVDCNEVDGGSGASCNTDGFCSNNINVPCVNEGPGNLDLSGGWQVNTSNELETSFVLSEAKSFQIDLFSPIQNSASGIDSIRVQSVDGLVLLAELTNLTKVLNIPEAVCQGQVAVSKELVPIVEGEDSIDSVLEQCSYSLKLIYPLNNGTQSNLVSVSVFDGDGAQLPIPSRLIIDSQAKFGRSQQELRVRTPIRPPVSELYDFVVFSEEEIVK